MEAREGGRKTEMAAWKPGKRKGRLVCGGRCSTQGSGGESRKTRMEVNGRWSMVAEMPRRPEEGDEEGSGRIKRKVCEARNVSAAEAVCLPQLLLALRPASETRVKDRDIASLCTRTPFPSFIYLCPSGRWQCRVVSLRLFSSAFLPFALFPLIIPL